MKKTACLFALLALIAVGTASAQPPVGAAAPTPLASQNHYKCYDIPEHEAFIPRDVRLKDQFGLTGAQVVRPFLHCNPVDKNQEGIPYPDVHLLCYEIIDSPDLGIWPLQIRNQFGSLNIRAERPRVLCVPSYKYHLSTLPDTDPDPGSGK